MYETRLRRTPRRTAAGQADVYNLDQMDVKIVEIPTLDDALKITFEKRRVQYFAVAETTLTPPLSDSIKIGDILAHVGELSTVGLLGGAQELRNYLLSRENWPISFDFRSPPKDVVDLSATVTRATPTAPAPVTSSAVFLPQIPSSRITTAPTVIYDGSAVDLTMDDEDDDITEVIVTETSSLTRKSTATPPILASSKQWFKGQIIKTRYGVGSVYQDSVKGEPLVVLLHWWREYQTGKDGPVKHPVVYLNMGTEAIVDCSKEKIMQYMAWPLTREEFARFQPGMYLNDTIIDIFLHRLVNEILPEPLRPRVHVMSSYFYSTLEEKKYEGVKRWTKNLDVFEKDFILIPVNDANHWSLAIICYLGRLAHIASTLPATSLANGQEGAVIPAEIGEAGESKNEHGDSEESSENRVTYEQTKSVNVPDLIPLLTSSSSASSKEEEELVLSEGQQLVEDSTLRPRRQTKRVKRLLEENSIEDQLRAIAKVTAAQEPSTPSQPPPKVVRSRSSSSAGKTKKPAKNEVVEEIPDTSPEIPVILKLDSTKTHQTRDVAKSLRLWAQQEWEHRKRKSPDDPSLVVDAKMLPVVAPPVPLQSNSCDCGVYLLQFAEQFLLDRAKVPFNCTLLQRNRNFVKQFGGNWFDQGLIAQKRLDMARFVLDHHL